MFKLRAALQHIKSLVIAERGVRAVQIRSQDPPEITITLGLTARPEDFQHVPEVYDDVLVSFEYIKLVETQHPRESDV